MTSGELVRKNHKEAELGIIMKEIEDKLENMTLCRALVYSAFLVLWVILMLPFQREYVKSDKGGAASMWWRKFDTLQPGVESTDGEFDRDLQDWEWHEKGKWKMTVSSLHVGAEHQVKLIGKFET